MTVEEYNDCYEELLELPLLSNSEYCKAVTERRVLDLGVSGDLAVIKLLRVLNWRADEFDDYFGYFDLNPETFIPGTNIMLVNRMNLKSDLYMNPAGQACLVIPEFNQSAYQGNNRFQEFLQNFTADSSRGRRRIATALKAMMKDSMRDENEDIVVIHSTRGDTEVLGDEAYCLIEMLRGKSEKTLASKYGEIYKRFAPKMISVFMPAALDEAKALMLQYNFEMEERMKKLHWDQMDSQCNYVRNDIRLQEMERARQLWRKVLKLMRVTGVNQATIDYLHYDMYLIYRGVTFNWGAEFVWPRTKEQCELS